MKNLFYPSSLGFIHDMEKKFFFLLTIYVPLPPYCLVFRIHRIRKFLGLPDLVLDPYINKQKNFTKLNFISVVTFGSTFCNFLMTCYL